VFRSKGTGLLIRDDSPLPHSEALISLPFVLVDHVGFFFQEPEFQSGFVVGIGSKSGLKTSWTGLLVHELVSFASLRGELSFQPSSKSFFALIRLRGPTFRKGVVEPSPVSSPKKIFPGMGVAEACFSPVPVKDRLYACPLSPTAMLTLVPLVPSGSDQNTHRLRRECQFSSLSVAE